MSTQDEMYIEELEEDIQDLAAQVVWLKHWICHNGGLIDDWAKEWGVSTPITLTEYIAQRLKAELEKR